MEPKLGKISSKSSQSSEKDGTDQKNAKQSSDTESALFVRGHLNRLTSVIVNTIQIVLQMSQWRYNPEVHKNTGVRILQVQW